MPLYTVTMKNGYTFQVRADDKDGARRLARDKARHHQQALGAKGQHAGDTPIEPASVRVNK